MFEKLKWMILLIFLIAVIYASHKVSGSIMTGTVEEPKTVVIDAGHGGTDPGKIGVNDALEKDINLAIAGQVKAYLEKNGIRVVMTREKDENLAKGKVEDLRKRTEIMNLSGGILAVSIHQNSYTSEKESGAQVFYFAESEKGEELAEILQKQLWKTSTGKQRQKKGSADYFVLKNTEIPVAIVECGFLSNWEEAEKLLKPEYQEEIAKAIGDGILEYVNIYDRKNCEKD